MLESLEADLIEFYQACQAIIEAHLLQPYSGNAKANLKNGLIERELHGAIHGVRVVLHTVMLHKLLAELWPEIVEAALAKTADYFGVTAAKILIALRYAGISHDLARQDDGADEWEMQSAQACYEILQKKNYPQNLNALILGIVEYKDDQYGFEQFCASQDYPSEYIAVFQYLRVLLNLADCMDIIGRTGRFQFGFICNTLHMLVGKGQRHKINALIVYAQELHTVIYEQGDMFFDCEIVLEDRSIVDTKHQGAHYDLAKKVRIEHSDNVLALMVNIFRKNPYFARLLAEEPQIEADYATVQTAWQPYIHGTSSLFFADYEKTQKMLAPVAMLEEFKRAPLGGEIYHGGHRGILHSNGICFGRLGTTDGLSRYSLQKIIDKYTRFTANSRERCLNAVKSRLRLQPREGYMNFHILKIEVARAKQLGWQSHEIVSADELAKISDDIENIIQIMHLTLFMGKFLFSKHIVRTMPNRNHDEIRSAVMQYLTPAFLLERIHHAALNLEAIYNAPTAENLLQVLALLEVHDKQYFTTEVINIKKHGADVRDAHFVVSTLIKGQENDSISHFLAHECLFTVMGRDHQADREQVVRQLTAAFRQQFQALRALLDYNAPDLLYTPQQQFFIDNAFPVVLIAESAEFGCSDFASMEFRSNQALKLGEAIKLIAVENLVQQIIVSRFLTNNKIAGVEVILLAELKKANLTLAKPHAPSQSTAAIPKLQWLAANVCATNLISSRAELSPRIF